MVDLSKVRPRRNPNSPQAIIRSPEFLQEAADVMPLGLLGRRPDQTIFSDFNFRGSGAETIPPGMGQRVFDEEPLMRKMLEERGLGPDFADKGVTFISKRRTPSRGNVKSFITPLHEMGHVAFERFPKIRSRILHPGGRLLRRFKKTKAKIGEEDFLKILEIRNGLERPSRIDKKQSIQMEYLRGKSGLNDPKLTKESLFADPQIQDMLRILDEEVLARLPTSKPGRNPLRRR
jgi:hypothetical protein